MNDETQPDGLAAFLAGAGYHIGHVGEVPADASESLIAAGCYYARRLLAAVEAVLDEHKPDHADSAWCGGCGFAWPCATVRAVTGELLTKAKTDAL